MTLTKRRRIPCQSTGFTLVEMLVVVFIVGLLAATLTVTLIGGSDRRLEREAERLAMVLQEGAALARNAGAVVAWKPDVSGYKLTLMRPRGLDGSLSAPQELRAVQLPESIRIARVKADGEESPGGLELPGRGLAGQATITLASENQEIDVESPGLSRYSLSTPRQRNAHAKP